MKRGLFNLAAGISVVMVVVFAGLWVWSHFRDAEFGYYGTKQGWFRDYYLNSSRGSISYVWFHPGFCGTRTREAFRFQIFKAARDKNAWSPLWAIRGNTVAVLGFIYEHEGSMAIPADPAPATRSSGKGTTMAWRVYAVPYWFLMLLAMVMPIKWWRRRRTLMWLAAGKCGVCGYDLRATPDRCPECGAAVEQFA